MALKIVDSFHCSAPTVVPIGNAEAHTDVTYLGKVPLILHGNGMLCCPLLGLLFMSTDIL